MAPVDMVGSQLPLDHEAMPRDGSTRTVSNAVRTRLADRLERDLKDPGSTPQPASFAAGRIDPNAVVAVLEDTELTHGDAADSVRAAYGASPAADAPSFDQIIELGFVRVIWGMAWWPRAIARAIDAAVNPIARHLRVLTTIDTGTRVALGPTARDRLRMVDDAAALALLETGDEERWLALGVFANAGVAPGWISAQLWNRSGDRAERLRWWYDRNSLIRNGCCTSDDFWSRDASKDLAEAVLQVLEREHDLLGWVREKARYERRVQIERGQLDTSEDVLLPVPETRPERIVWLSQVEDGAWRSAYDGREELFALVWLALRAAQADRFSDAPHPVVRRLVDLGADRPAIWTALH